MNRNADRALCPADRIAQLEDELAEVAIRVDELQGERAEHERTKAELAEARADAEGYKLLAAQHERERNQAWEERQATFIAADVDGWRKRCLASEDAHERTKAELAKVTKERDDNLLLGGDVNCDEVNRHGCGICHSCLRAAHERTKAELIDARASLAKVRHDRDEMIRVHDEVEAARDVAQAELAKMRTIIEQQLWRAENPVESFEQQAETFYHDTGIVAPGKSTPLEWGDRWTDEARRTAWNEWLKKRDAEQFALWRSALGGNAGRALAERVPLWRELAQHAERLRMSKYTDPDAMMRVQETLLRLAALNKKGNDE